MSGKRHRSGFYPRGEDHIWHRLTEADVMEIRKAYYEGTKQDELAERYGASQCTISKIVNGYTWAHLPVLPDRKSERV